MSASPSRHEQRKAATHQCLLDAARDAIAGKGYSNVEILDITEQANVSKATFYKHFANKEECVRELMEQGFDALLAQILGDGTLAITPEWVRRSFEQIFDWAEDNRELLLVMVGGGASTRLNAFGRSYMARIIERTIVTRFEQNVHTPRFSADVTAQIITGIMIQLLGWWLETDTGYTTTEMAHIVADTLRYGIAPDEF
jgi:AcrR family transcriptional regulator